ncbi:MAG: hypothetical protein ACKV2O_24255 [Acidimicrobiales bacterium]
MDHSLLIVDGNIDNRGVYVPLTRGRHSNHAYVALEPDDPRTPRDVLSEAICRDWADIPAITYRHQLQIAAPAESPPAAVPQQPLDPSRLREVARDLARRGSRRAVTRSVSGWLGCHRGTPSPGAGDTNLNRSSTKLR